jgi:hypothetical protein
MSFRRNPVGWLALCVVVVLALGSAWQWWREVPRNEPVLVSVEPPPAVKAESAPQQPAQTAQTAQSAIDPAVTAPTTAVSASAEVRCQDLGSPAVGQPVTSQSPAATQGANAAINAEDHERILKTLRSTSLMGELAAIALGASARVEREFNSPGQAATTCPPGSSPCAAAPGKRAYSEVMHAVYADASVKAQRLALGSAQPAAYQVALHLCSFVPPSQSESCSRPLLKAWTASEPDNATPWLMLSAAERQWGEAQAAEEALYRASIASSVQDGAKALWGVLAEPGLMAEPAAATHQLHQHWGALIAGMNYASLGNVSGLCSETAVRDGNLHQRCDAIAQRMLKSGGSLIHRVEGLAMGHRLDWPQERLAQQRAQVHALLRADSEELRAQAAKGPCEALQASRSRSLRMASQGEVAGLQARVAAPQLATPPRDNTLQNEQGLYPRK